MTLEKGIQSLFFWGGAGVVTGFLCRVFPQTREPDLSARRCWCLSNSLPPLTPGITMCRFCCCWLVALSLTCRLWASLGFSASCFLIQCIISVQQTETTAEKKKKSSSRPWNQTVWWNFQSRARRLLLCRHFVVLLDWWMWRAICIHLCIKSPPKWSLATLGKMLVA